MSGPSNSPRPVERLGVESGDGAYNNDASLSDQGLGTKYPSVIHLACARLNETLGLETDINDHRLERVNTVYQRLCDDLYAHFPNICASLREPNPDSNSDLVVIYKIVEPIIQRVIPTKPPNLKVLNGYIHDIRTQHKTQILGPNLLDLDSYNELLNIFVKHSYDDEPEQVNASDLALLGVYIYLQAKVDLEFVRRTNAIRTPYTETMQRTHLNSKLFRKFLYDVHWARRVDEPRQMFRYRMNPLVPLNIWKDHKIPFLEGLSKAISNPDSWGVLQLCSRGVQKGISLEQLEKQDPLVSELMPFILLYTLDDTIIKILNIQQRYGENRKRIQVRDSEEVLMSRSQELFPLIKALITVRKRIFLNEDNLTTSHPLTRELRGVFNNLVLLLVNPLVKDFGLKDFIRRHNWGNGQFKGFDEDFDGFLGFITPQYYIRNHHGLSSREIEG